MASASVERDRAADRRSARSGGEAECLLQRLDLRRAAGAGSTRRILASAPSTGSASRSSEPGLVRRSGRARRRPPRRRSASAAAGGSQAARGSRRRRPAGPRRGCRAPAAPRRTAAPCGRRSRAGARSPRPSSGAVPGASPATRAVARWASAHAQSSTHRGPDSPSIARTVARDDDAKRRRRCTTSCTRRARRTTSTSCSVAGVVLNRRLRRRLVGSGEWEEFAAEHGRAAAARRDGRTRTNSARITTAA